MSLALNTPFIQNPFLFSLVDQDSTLIPMESLLTLSKAPKGDIWWKCEFDDRHSYTRSLKDQANAVLNLINPCLICRGKAIQVGVNDLGTTDPAVFKFWDFKKNECGPEAYTRKSTANVWWKCRVNHEFQAHIYNMTRKFNSCPICSGKIVVKGINDALSKYPELLENLVSPKEDLEKVTLGTHTKFTWLCTKEGITYKRIPSNQVAGNFRCPRCSKSEASKTSWTKRKTHYIKLSQLEKDIGTFLDSQKGEISLIRNFWTKKTSLSNPFEIDFLLPQINVAIEVNGDYWHSDKMAVKMGFNDAEERHKKKRAVMESMGYKLFFVWEYDWITRKEEITESLKNVLAGGNPELLKKLRGPNPKFLKFDAASNIQPS